MSSSIDAELQSKRSLEQNSSHSDGADSIAMGNCCETNETTNVYDEIVSVEEDRPDKDALDGRSRSRRNRHCANQINHSYAANKNVAEGLMDIALLSANANQLRFLITYNHSASTYYFSLGLVIVSLALQVIVGIALIFKRRMQRCNDKRYTRTHEFLIGGVFLITVVNILLAAFTTTTDERQGPK